MPVLHLVRPERSSSWRDTAARCVTREPLFDTQSSLAALRHAPGESPRTLFMGVGLCTKETLSRGVPIDLLGMLLPAEILRRELSAAELLVLVADSHALENGFAPAEVERRARAVEATLGRIQKACRLSALRVVRASELHGAPGHRRTLRELRRATQGPVIHDYVLRQFADVLFLDEERGPLLKVGWALRGEDPSRRSDEWALDRALEEVAQTKVRAVYCKPGRALTDAAPRMPPYVVKRPEARLCMDRPEDARAKLRAASDRASPHTVRGFRRHLRRLVYTFARTVEPLPGGSLEEKVAALVERVGA